MTKHVDTAFERHFSEPPVVAVKEGRTHCEACKEPLDPTMMHKCHGNQMYQPPVFSSTEITEKCPKCAETGVLVKPGSVGTWRIYVVVCSGCRTYVYLPVEDMGEAIANWNRIASCGASGEPSWATWRADMPGDDERLRIYIRPENSQITLRVNASLPDLTNYHGACPAVHVEGETCNWCKNTGTIPPTKPEGAQ